MKAFDRYKKELTVGDNVVFTANGWLERGYIYKIINGKVYMTTLDKNSKPVPHAFKLGEKYYDTGYNIKADGTSVLIGYINRFIIKID